MTLLFFLLLVYVKKQVLRTRSHVVGLLVTKKSLPVNRFLALFYEYASYLNLFLKASQYMA
jgi:hypothetical protein